MYLSASQTLVSLKKLEKVLLFKEVAQEGEFYLFEVNEGGNGASVIVEHNTVFQKQDKVLVQCTMQHSA